MRAQDTTGLQGKITYRLKDANGNAKKIFEPNKLGAKLIKKGIISPKANQTLLAILGLGSFKEAATIPNLVVDAGKAAVASRINGAGGEALFNYVAVGTGTTTPAATDTALQTEVARQAATVSRVTTSVTNDTAKMETTFNFTASYAITEAGTFNASTGGTMLNRHTFSAINVNSGDALTISVEIQVS